MKIEETRRKINDHYVYKTQYIFEAQVSTADVSTFDEDALKYTLSYDIEKQIMKQSDKLKKLQYDKSI